MHVLRNFRVFLGPAIVRVIKCSCVCFVADGAMASRAPVLLSLEQLAVGGDLELESELRVHQILQLLHDRLELGAHLGHVALQVGVLVLQLPLALLLLRAQVVQFALQRVVLRQRKVK